MKYKSELKHGFINPEAVARRCLAFKEVFLKISQNSQENTCTRASFLIKLKTLWHRCFLVNFAIFLRPLFFIEHLPWLLLLIVAICTVLFYKLYTLFRLKETLSQGICNFFFKMFQMRFSRFSNIWKQHEIHQSSLLN